MATVHHYFLSIADLAQARGSDPDLSYDGAGPNDFAAALQEALRSPMLFERWRNKQDEPDDVDPGLGGTDANAAVTGKLAAGLNTDVEVRTVLPMSILRHRLNLLIGPAWQLRDMR
ncbi:hypothetical protein [Dyella sp.]|uniref:hypothetical protein n=1 Tax=Dyella sp. TaxID=1869338 RepID=UPI002ED13D09